MAAISNVPFKNVLGMVTGQIVRVSDDWRRWLQEVKDRIDRVAAQVTTPVALSAQAAGSSGTVAQAVAAGLYRVSWLLRVTQAATVSSSVQLTIGSTVDGVAGSQTSPAMTTNTVAAALSGSFLVAADAASDITYTLAYASVGATAMQCHADISAEGLPA